MAERWDDTRARDLAALCDVALPGENLTEDELGAALWDRAPGEAEDPTVVLASSDGAGAIAGVVHEVAGGRRVGFVQLVAVHPDARRQGIATSLLSAFRAWAVDEAGVSDVAVGGAAPFYLWPGVDVRATAALCLFEANGFRPRGCELNLSYPTQHRAAVPPGVTLRRALEEQDVAAGLAFVGRHWPNWVAEANRAVEHASCHLAFADDGAVVGFGCHSVNRLGWLGPMGTDPERRARGLGNALLGAIATDLMVAGLSTVEVAWVGPVGFYVKAAGASVSRTFRTLAAPA